MKFISYNSKIVQLQTEPFSPHTDTHLGSGLADMILHVFNFWCMNNSAEVKLTCDSTNPSWESGHYCWEYSMELATCKRATYIKNKCRQCCQGTPGVLRVHNSKNRLKGSVLYCLHCKTTHCGL